MLPPDVNESAFGFAITAKGIRFGLGAVKNVGEGAVESVIEARASSGPFRSLDDFCARIDLARCNKRVLESLIRCGATDQFGPRLVQLGRLDAVLATAQREQRDRASGQVGLFASLGLATEIISAPVTSGPEASRKELLSWEKELLGIYLSDHPLQEVVSRMGDVVTAYLAELKEEEEQGLVIVACVVTTARKHITKEKKLMMFAQVEDLTGTVEATIFPRTYEATAAVWNTDEILLVLGRVEKRDDAPKLLVEHAVRFNDDGIRDIKRVLEETRERLAKRAKFVRPAAAAESPSLPKPAAPAAPAEARPTELVIRFREALDYERSIVIFQRIQEVLKDFSGGAAVVLELPRATGGARRVPTSFRASVSADVAEAVEREVGKDVVEVLLPPR